MKTPGIFYRISFLVVLNSLLIFALVAFISIEHNEAKMNRLISYRFDFIGEYYRAELDNIKSHELGDLPTSAISNQTIAVLLQRSGRCMKALAGLTLLASREDNQGYRIQATSFRPDLKEPELQDYERIILEASRELLGTRGVQIGEQFSTPSGIFTTMYIPWDVANPDLVLAITFSPQEITGPDTNYNYLLVILFLVTTLITLLIINLLFRNFIRPLQHLIQGMEKTTVGEVAYKIEDVKNDEIGRVAAAFNIMSGTLWKKRQQLTESNRNLTQTLKQLSNANVSLAKSEAFLSRLIENAPFAVVVTDMQGRIMIFSRAAMSTFCSDAQDKGVIGRNWAEFFPHSPKKLIPRPGEEDRVLQEEMICTKSNGESFPAFVCRVPIRENQLSVSAYLFILRDISESKGFQEMMISIDRMVTRGVMAGEIAHEINNYLAVILGNIELLPLFLSRGEMDKVEKKLEVLRNSVARIQNFSEGLMGYGNEEAVIEPGDLNQNIENLIAFVKPQNRYDGIAFNLSLSHELPLVDFDSSQIQHMLLNLLNNAADALREKKSDRRIDIATELVDDRRSVLISIVDNACGLPSDLDEVIFKARYNGRRRGRGFGLMAVKRIIDRHAGVIDYVSVTDIGTTFKIKIPVKGNQLSGETSLNPPSQVSA